MVFVPGKAQVLEGCNVTPKNIVMEIVTKVRGQKQDAEASKNGARLDTAAMQLHMAKKRQVNAERNMAMSRQRLGRMAASKTVAATKSAVAHKPDYSSYPQAPQRSEVSGMGGLKNTAAVISAMKTASSRSTIQKELVRIEEEFVKRV